MKLLIIFLAGAVGGVVGTLLWQRMVGRKNTTTPPFGYPSLPCRQAGSTEEGKKTETLIARQRREKEEDKERIYGLLETNTPLAVGAVEQMLGIPESSATRYFDELEKEGKVRQVGKTGAGVHYERAEDADSADKDADERAGDADSADKDADERAGDADSADKDADERG